MTECNNLPESPSDVRSSKEAIWRSTHCALYCNALQIVLSIILIAYWSTKEAIWWSTHCTLCHIALEIAYYPSHKSFCTLHTDQPKKQYETVQTAHYITLQFALCTLIDQGGNMALCKLQPPNHPELIKDYLLTAKRARGLLLLNCNFTHHKRGWTGHLNSKYCRKAISWHLSWAFGGALSSFFQWQLAGQYAGLVSRLFFSCRRFSWDVWFFYSPQILDGLQLVALLHLSWFRWWWWEWWSLVMLIHAKNVWCCGEGYFGQKKIAEKVRKSQQNVNRDKSA